MVGYWYQRGDHLKAVNCVCRCDYDQDVFQRDGVPRYLGSVNPRDVSALGKGVQAWELIMIFRLSCMKKLEDGSLQMSFFETRSSS